jgi:hypothetical protein
LTGENPQAKSYSVLHQRGASFSRRQPQSNHFFFVITPLSVRSIPAERQQDKPEKEQRYDHSHYLQVGNLTGCTFDSGVTRIRRNTSGCTHTTTFAIAHPHRRAGFFIPGAKTGAGMVWGESAVSTEFSPAVLAGEREGAFIPAVIATCHNSGLDAGEINNTDWTFSQDMHAGYLCISSVHHSNAMQKPVAKNHNLPG